MVSVTFRHVKNITGDKGDKGDTGTFADADAVSVPAGTTDLKPIMTGPETARKVTFKIPKGERGLPGPNAVPTDEVVATMLGADDTQTGRELVERVLSMISDTAAWVGGPRLLDATADRSLPRLVKPLDGPILRFQDQPAKSLYFPTLTDMRPHGIDECWLLYSTDHETVHADSGIFLATAPHPLGPWTAKGRIFRDDGPGAQTETPSTVFRNPATGALNFLYSQGYDDDGGPGGVGKQSTLIAKSLDNGATWQRHGIVLDQTPGTPGDGHTGYASVFMSGGSMYARSLYGGGVTGQMGLWRAPQNPYDPWQLVGYHGLWVDKIRRFSYEGDTGIPSATPGSTEAQNLRAYMGGPIVSVRGRVMQILSTGVRASGLATTPRRIATAPLRPDFMSLSEQAADITPVEQAWEGGPVDSLGSACEWDGRIYMPYRAGAQQGGFGIMEVL